jgi:hypothetical protein
MIVHIYLSFECPLLEQEKSKKSIVESPWGSVLTTNMFLFLGK